LEALEKKIDSNITLSAEEQKLMSSLLNDPPEDDSKKQNAQLDYNNLNNEQMIAVIGDMFGKELKALKEEHAKEVGTLRQYIAALATKGEMDDVRRGDKGELYSKIESDVIEVLRTHPKMSVEDATIFAAARKDPTLLIPKAKPKAPPQQGQSPFGPSGIVEGLDENVSYKDAAKEAIKRLREASA